MPLQLIIFRPPDIVMSADLRFTTDSFFFFRQLPAELAERNSTIFGHMVGSKCNLKMRVRNLGYPIPLQTGGPKPPFWRFRNLRTIHGIYISEPNTIYTSGWVRCKLQGVSYIVSKPHELWYINGFKLEVSFHPPSVNSAFHFIARLSRRRSANGTQPNFAIRWTVRRANNLP